MGFFGGGYPQTVEFDKMCASSFLASHATRFWHQERENMVNELCVLSGAAVAGGRQGARFKLLIVGC